MNLPISWGIAIGPASQLLRQTAGITKDSANQLFGSLFQSAPPAAVSGPLAAPLTQSLRQSQNRTVSFDDRRDQLRDRLSSILNDARSKFGRSKEQNSTSNYMLEWDGITEPKVEGAEPLRTEVSQSIMADKPLLAELQSIYRNWSESHPLSLLPQRPGKPENSPSFKIRFT